MVPFNCPGPKDRLFPRTKRFSFSLDSQYSCSEIGQGTFLCVSESCVGFTHYFWYLPREKASAELIGITGAYGTFIGCFEYRSLLVNGRFILHYMIACLVKRSSGVTQDLMEPTLNCLKISGFCHPGPDSASLFDGCSPKGRFVTLGSGIAAWNSALGGRATLSGFATALWWCFGNWPHQPGVYSAVTVSNDPFMNYSPSIGAPLSNSYQWQCRALLPFKFLEVKILKTLKGVILCGCSKAVRLY